MIKYWRIMYVGTYITLIFQRSNPAGGRMINEKGKQNWEYTRFIDNSSLCNWVLRLTKAATKQKYVALK